MTDAPVLYERRDRIGVLTLNRPDNRNSMTPALLDAFSKAMGEAAADDEIRCLVLTGKGRCFSAGADFRSDIQRFEQGALPFERSYAMYAPFLGVLDVAVPVIGALNGHAVGGGFGLSLLCDIRYAAKGSKYGANFARLGLHSGLGISYVLPRLVGVSKAAELLFTGRLVLGEEAERIGLVSEALEPEAVLPRALSLAAEMAAAAPTAVRTMKATLYRGLDWDVRRAAMHEAHVQAATLLTDDAQEGVRALLEKREPEFHGR